MSLLCIYYDVQTRILLCFVEAANVSPVIILTNPAVATFSSPTRYVAGVGHIRLPNIMCSVGKNSSIVVQILCLSG